MSPYIVLVVYGGAVALAIVLLYRFETRAWYLHLLSLALALVIGYVPTPQFLDSPMGMVLTGFVIVFLLFWGLGGVLLAMAPHHHKHA